MKVDNEKLLTMSLSYDVVKNNTLGFVIKDEEDDEDDPAIGIYIPRLMPLIDGAQFTEESFTVDIKSRLLNSKTKDISDTSVKTRNYVEVLPMQNNNIAYTKWAKGERVMIEFIDEDFKSMSFKPCTFPGEDKYRKTDVARFYVCAKDEDKSDPDDESAYFFEINSREQIVRLRTANKNGEKCPFTLNLNTKDGIITLYDDDKDKRLFTWDHDTDMIEWKTEGKIIHQLKDNKVYIECEDYELIANNSIHMKTSELTVDADKGIFNIDQEEHHNTGYKGDGSTLELKYQKVTSNGGYYIDLVFFCHYISPSRIDCLLFIIDMNDVVVVSAEQ